MKIVKSKLIQYVSNMNDVILEKFIMQETSYSGIVKMLIWWLITLT